MMNFSRWFRKVCVIFGIVASAAIALMIISTTVDTTLRFTINFPIPGVFELN